jgi:predicted RNA-binding protein YlqC (UPF0109 family)
MDEVTYLKMIIEPLISNPKELSFIRTIDDRGVLINVYAGKEDISQIIGKKGTTANSLRNIMHTFGYKINKNVCIKINPK